MANTTRNTFTPKGARKKVIVQRGMPAVDSEINEMQDILGEELAEGVRNAVGGSVMSGAAAFSVGGWARLVAELGHNQDGTGTNSWEPTASGTADIVIKRGVAYVDGWRAILAQDVSLAAQAISFAAPGSNTHGIIYAEFSMAEVTSATDPTIATAQLGETSLRQNLVVAFKVITSTVSYDDALNALTLFAPTQPKSLRQGAAARLVIGRWYQAAGQATIALNDIVDMRTVTQTGQAFQTCVRMLRAKQVFSSLAWAIDTGPSAVVAPDAASDGMVAWNAVAGRLIIGVATSTAGDSRLDAGMRLRKPAGIRHTVENTTGVVRVQNGGASADGTQIVQDVTKGYYLVDGQALGYPSVGYSTDYPQAGFSDLHATSQRGANHHFLHTLQLAQTGALPRTSITPAPAGGAVPVLIAQTPVVAKYTDFSGGLGFLGADAFVICYRDGDDIVWWNGRVTRGSSAGWVLDAPNGESLSGHDALIAANGTGQVAQGDAFERALEFLTQAGQGGAFGSDVTNTRSLRFRVRKGVWLLTRKLHAYGTQSENVNWYDHTLAGSAMRGSSLRIEGEDVANCELRIEPSVNAAETPGLLTFNVGSFRMSGVTVRQDVSTTSNSPRYTLHVSANDILIEDCTFVGPVLLEGRRIRVRRCQFLPLEIPGKTMVNAAFSTAPWVAQGLYLKRATQATGTNLSHVSRQVVVEDNYFAFNEQYGTHAGVIVDSNTSSARHMWSIRRNLFYYNMYGSVGMIGIPAIAILAVGNDITIYENSFQGAAGIVKTGTAFVDGASPFDGNYTGSPLSLVGGLNAKDGSSSAGTKLVSCGYITCLVGRRSTSTLRIVRNIFDLSDVGGNSSTAAARRWTCWGAYVQMINPNIVAYAGAYGVSTLEFSNNTLDMFRRSVGWGLQGVEANNPAIWGFYVAPTFQDNAGSTLDLQVHGIAVRNNTFNLGPMGAVQTTWRSTMGYGPNTVFGGDGFTNTVKYMLDSSCCVGIVLKAAATGAYTASGRRAAGIVVSGNTMTQLASPVNESSVLLNDYRVNALDPYFGALMIHVALGDGAGQHTTGNANPSIDGSLTNASIATPIIENNSVFAPSYYAAIITSGYVPTFAFHGFTGGRIANNSVRLGDVSGYLGFAQLAGLVNTVLRGNIADRCGAVFGPAGTSKLYIGLGNERLRTVNATPNIYDFTGGLYGAAHTDFFKADNTRTVRIPVSAANYTAGQWAPADASLSTLVGITQVSVSDAHPIFFPIIMPAGARTLLSVGVILEGASGHAALPAAMPTIVVIQYSGNDATVLMTTTVDSAPATAAAYEEVHAVYSNIPAGTFRRPDLPLADPATTALSLVTHWLRVKGETGANSLVGLRVLAIEITYGD